MMSRFCSLGPGLCEYAVAQASKVRKTMVSRLMCFLLENAGVYYILRLKRRAHPRDCFGTPPSRLWRFSGLLTALGSPHATQKEGVHGTAKSKRVSGY